MAPRRIAVTGTGIVSPLGEGTGPYWQALLAGRSGVRALTEWPGDKLRTDVIATVTDFDASRYLSPKEAANTGRVAQLCLGAGDQAVREAGLDGVDRTRVGVLVSTGQGAVEILEDQILKCAARGPRAVSPYFIPSVMLNAVSAVISQRHGFMGPSFNLASACATSSHSLATAGLLLLAGEADVVLAGGGESATRPSVLAGFGNARALARSFAGDPARASRPYDADRSGFVLGEGAAVLALETEEHARARAARPLGYLVGWGMTSDAEHITRPNADGRGLELAVARALSRAEIGAGDVGYINPHATSTPQGDLAEYTALLRVFGERLRAIPISATKSMTGHLLGGAGAAEAVAVLCSLRDQRLHPSINVDRLDPAFDLALVREASRADVRYALSTSAGFGGHNCALVFERAA